MPTRPDDRIRTPGRFLRIVAAGAVLFGGVLAGLTADRSRIQMAAWQHIGVIPWATFTRAAYQVPGFVLNPAVGLAALLLTLGTAIAGRSVQALRGRRVFPIYAAAAFAVIGAIITRGILVPLMMRIRDPAVSVLELQQIFVSGSQWWVANDIVHVLAFAFNLWALLVICSVAAPANRETDA